MIMVGAYHHTNRLITMRVELKHTVTHSRSCVFASEACNSALMFMEAQEILEAACDRNAKAG